MNYFKQLLDLLKIEREEDKLQYLKVTEQSSVTDRRASGLTWYPVAIRGTEISRGDYLTVELERTSHQEVFHKFRFGMPAVFFCNHDAKADRVEGTVSSIFGNRLKLTLKTDELPEWAQDGKLGVDLSFDDNSYDEMENALKRAALLKEEKTVPLIEVLTGEKAPSFKSLAETFTLSGLNESQSKAVNQILSANELAIVHGPPGTGKTTTLIQAVKALIRQDHKQILVCAPSNTAVDLLAEKLDEEGLRVLRVGNPARVNEKLMALTLDAQVSGHDLMKEARKLKKQAQEYKNLAHKYKRNFGREEREQRKLLFDEAHKITKEIDKTEQYIIEDLVNKAQIIAATLVGCNHYTVRHLKFKTVIIDEAGQALEPACWIPVLKAERVILAGDHCQLPPTIKSIKASTSGLSKTLLEKCVDNHPSSVVLLEVQYRMNTAIMSYSSKVFYQDKLLAHESVANHSLYPGDKPLVFVDTAGCGFNEKLDGTSTTNPEEAAFLLKHLSKVLTESTEFDKYKPSIAIISPYKQQVNILRQLIEHASEIRAFLPFISINTVDSFQGQERDIVYISMTRSNASGEIGFLSDIRRMNVAMTRARKKLVVIGDSATLAQFPYYNDFIAFSENKNAWETAWETI